ncbi:MAG TPA: hypothetical protein VIE38_02360 [Gaiellaceae bacterium]
MTEPAVAFQVRDHERPRLEVRVNFGVLTRRSVTPAEIDDLARLLRTIAPTFEIVAEDRHEFGDSIEMSVHQVVIEMAETGDDVAKDVIGTAEIWASACYQARHIDI